MIRPQRVTLLKMSHAYLFEDFDPLVRDPQLLVQTLTPSGNPPVTDIIMLPGSTDIAADYDELVACGFDRWILQHAEAGKCIFGICGGLQLMGRRLYDPEHCRYDFLEKRMLGLLDIETTFQKDLIYKRLRNVTDPWGNQIRGFESHRGISSGEEPVCFRRETGEALGYGHGKLLATYLHRCLHNQSLRESLLAHAAS